jgi:hypothetical protein
MPHVPAIQRVHDPDADDRLAGVQALAQQLIGIRPRLLQKPGLDRYRDVCFGEYVKA